VRKLCRHNAGRGNSGCGGVGLPCQNGGGQKQSRGSGAEARKQLERREKGGKKSKGIGVEIAAMSELPGDKNNSTVESTKLQYGRAGRRHLESRQIAARLVKLGKLATRNPTKIEAAGTALK
jgi:hypothetical protein